MIEQKIEEKIMQKFADALAAANISGVQLIGGWQTNVAEKAKQANTAALIVVKVKPRQYDSFTIPEAIFPVEISLAIRVEEDVGGENYLAISDAIQNVMNSWQRSYAGYSATFAIDGEFKPTGFRIDGGDCGLDSDFSTWSMSQSCSAQGIILNQ